MTEVSSSKPRTTNATPRMHPDGMAALIAAVVADLDVRDLGLSPTGHVQALRRALDRRQEQVLAMARAYYKIYPVDFANEVGWQERLRTNAMNNRAKLDRANLR